MKKVIAIVCLAVGLISTQACKPKMNVTTDVRNRAVANNIALTKLQYYIDRDVVLKRVITTGETKVSSGTIKVENGKQVQIIRLKKGTPGICTLVQPDRLVISFEEGANKNLTFAAPRNLPPTSSYVLVCSEVDKNNFGKITYDGKVYTVEPDGVRAKIKIKKTSDTKVKVKKDTMKGRKV
jgi:hypothetical protein